uniref:Exocyst complex component Sec8 n=2 Tax=Cacopsylla melanoneura TaxID=428564 RepID=A0A8D8V530_9HEMI
MDIPPPTKPPRGVKPPKETSGLLMSVIRTLSASESNEQRDRERAKLEKEYKKSDKQIEEYVSLHHEDLTQIMQLFAKLSSLVSSSKERITTVRENLQACKVLLSCRHEELKKLWLEGVEHKHMIQLLEDIEQIKEMPSKVNAHMSKKQYLTATRLVISSLAACEGSLSQVEALKQLRNELQNKKQQLHTCLTQDLSRHIYLVSTQDILPSLRRQGSLRDRQGSGREFGGGGFTRGSELRTSQRLARKHSVVVTSGGVADGVNGVALIAVGSGDKEQVLEEDLSLADPESDSAHFVKIIIECLILLNKLPDTVEKIKTDMETQLRGLILRTTQDLLASSSGSDPAAQGSLSSSQCLIQLLNALMEQFKAVLAVHRDVVLKYIRTKSNLVLQLYTESFVWNIMQRTLQSLLSSYLNIKGGSPHTNSSQATSLTNGNVGDDIGINLSSYYARKKPVAKTRKVLFKFDHSTVSHNSGGIPSVSDTGSFTDTRHKLLLVKPDPAHITTLYTPLMGMIDEFDVLVSDSAGTPEPSSLAVFINDYVRDIYLVEYHDTLLASVESVTKSSDSWRSITSVAQNSALDLPKPLLQSVVRVDEKLQQLKHLMDCLPHHVPNVYHILISVLRNFHDTCQAGYRGIVQPDPEDRRICSAAWLKDEDICRFLKSLPNWLELAASRRKRKLSHPIEESPETVRDRNIKEAEMLSQNLSGGSIGAHEIISDINQLKCLAQLQESMEWFSSRLSLLLSPSTAISTSQGTTFSAIPQIYVTSAAPQSDSVTSQLSVTLESLAGEFLELAHTCLLVLHLEVRVQCFHYLLPKKNNIYVEPKVIELSRSLATLDEAMSTCLQPEKTKYIFEGIGDMIGKILMSSVQFWTRIDQSDVNKMGRHIYTLQQSIASITMSREISLDQTRRYFHLLTLSPDEILNDILESGPQYTDLEYMHALQLIHRCRTRAASPTTDPNIHMNRLNDILTEMRRKY